LLHQEKMLFLILGTNLLSGGACFFITKKIFILFLAPLLIMKANRYVSPLGWLVKVNFAREMIVVTSMVVLVMGTFLVVQWPYVFANVTLETDLSKFGVAPYSEYVKRGFVDLLKVVSLVFATAWMGVLINKNQVNSLV